MFIIFIYLFILSGYLDPSSESDDLLPGTKLDLPCWMARGLCSRQRHIVSVESPKQYRTAYRQILTADANVVDLHKLGPYFYRFGSHLLNFEHPDAADIAKCLLKVCNCSGVCWFIFNIKEKEKEELDLCLSLKLMYLILI